MDIPRAEVSLQTLGLANIKEVLEMEDDEVATEIEAFMVKAAASILSGQGYAVRPKTTIAKMMSFSLV